MFQSTRPMRGATGTEVWHYYGSGVSIHAPHAGRDVGVYGTLFMQFLFQSTRPMRGATLDALDVASGTEVSIHAPHAGRDSL